MENVGWKVIVVEFPDPTILGWCKMKIMRKIKIIILMSLLLLLIPIINAALDPSAVYCREMGYEFNVVETEKGQIGVCKMPNGEEINGRDFLQGKKGQEYSYCQKEGYSIKTIKNNVLCSSIQSMECAVCVLENKEEIEVTKLMNLSFTEAVCGDGICYFGIEDYPICPKDCPSGLADAYCDGVNDTKCDPDCENNETNKDPDCPVIPKPEEIVCVDGDGTCYCECLGKDNDCNTNSSFGTPCATPEYGIYEPQKIAEKEIYKFKWLIIALSIILLLIISIVIFIAYKKKLGKKDVI